MRIRFLGGLLAAGLLLVPVAASPAFAVDGDYLVDLLGDTSAVYGSSMKVIECWGGQPGTTYLLVKKSGGWTRVASAQGRKSKFCDGDNLATYTWKVKDLPKKNANGNRWLSVAVSGTPYFSKWTYPEKVQVMTQAEWDAENPSQSATPSTSPSTTPSASPSGPTSIAPASPPSEPTYVAANASSTRGHLSIVWQPPAISGGSPVTYEIRVNGNAVKSGIVENSYTLTGLADSTTYSISVYAQNASGLSNSTTINAKTPARPLTPEEQEVAANPGKKKVTISIIGPGPVEGSRTNETGGYDTFGASSNPAWSYWVKPYALASVNFFRAYGVFAPGEVPRGTVTCEIRINGQVATRSSGDYVFGVTSCVASIR